MAEKEETTIKCVRCSAEFVFGDISSTHPRTRTELIEDIVKQLFWKKSFAGWVCPRHD